MKNGEKKHQQNKKNQKKIHKNFISNLVYFFFFNKMIPFFRSHSNLFCFIQIRKFYSVYCGTWVSCIK